MKLTLSQVVCLAAAAYLFIVYSPAHADIYQYTNEKGDLVFTDDPSKVPNGMDKAQKVYRDADENPKETSFILANTHIIVPVTVSYKGRTVKGQFVFDTGASGSIICPKIARQLEISPDNSSLALIEGVNGRSVAGMVTLDWISIGPNQAHNVSVPITAVGNYDGILGNDLLGGSRFQIDYGARRIRWQ